MKEKILILASGGLDSTVLVHMYHSLGYDVHIMYIDHDNKNKEAELDTIDSIMLELKIPCDHLYVHKADFGWSKSGTLNGSNSKNYYIEMRNLVFVSMAISLAEAIGAVYIAIGLIHCEDCPFPDSTTDFLYKMDSLAQSTIGASVVAPLINANKEQVFELAKKFNIKRWFTCFEPLVDGEPCGACPACKASIYNNGTLYSM